MPELHLHHQNSTITLFYNFNSEYEDITSMVTDNLQVFPSLRTMGAFYKWKMANPKKISIDVNTFKTLFLTEDAALDIKTKFNGPQFVCFAVYSDALSNLITEFSKLTPEKLSEDIIKQEQNAQKEDKPELFPLNYKFPLSFVAENVKIQLRFIKSQKSSSSEEDDEEGGSSKVKLTPAHKIYDRISHDPTMDKDLFVIGYLDRFSGIKEVDFTKFITLGKERHYNTSIPFHRIRHFKYRGNVVWDRESRLNLISGNAYTKFD